MKPWLQTMAFNYGAKRKGGFIMLKQKRKNGVRLLAMLLTAVLMLPVTGTEVFALSSTEDNYCGHEIGDNRNFYYLYNKAPQKEEIVFGSMDTTGPLTMKRDDDTYRFEVRNNSSSTLKVLMGIATSEKNGVKMHISTSFGDSSVQTVGPNRSYTELFSDKEVKSGESIWFECSTISGENDTIARNFEIRAAAVVQAVGSSSSSSSSGVKAPADKTIVNAAPTIAVTKYSANKVHIVVTMHNKYARSKGYSTLAIYKGSKKIKTLTSDGKQTMTYTYSAKGAASGKYKVKQTSTGNSKDSKTSKTVSAKANTWKLASYSTRDISLFKGVGIQIESASYSGSTLVLKGFLYNTEKSTVTEEISVAPTCDGVKLGRFSKTMKIKPGITSYTIKIKKAKVVDLVNGEFIPGLGG